MQKQLVSFELPFLSEAVDYHEFEGTVSLIQSIIDPKIKIVHEELFCMGNYVAVVFDKKHRPSLEDVVELLLDNKYTPKVLESHDFSYNGKTPNVNELSVIAQKIKLDKKIKNISTSSPTLKV